MFEIFWICDAVFSPFSSLASYYGWACLSSSINSLQFWFGVILWVIFRCRCDYITFIVLQLMNFAHGKIVLALEGGYNLESVANSVLACVEVLLEDNPIRGSSEAYPFESTWRVIQAVKWHVVPFWFIIYPFLPPVHFSWLLFIMNHW